jgi:hypothetical protein
VDHGRCRRWPQGQRAGRSGQGWVVTAELGPTLDRAESPASPLGRRVRPISMGERLLAGLLACAACAVAVGCGSGRTHVSVATTPKRVAPSTVGPYHFVGRPIVVRWVEPPNFKQSKPEFAVYYRLSRPLEDPTPPSGYVLLAVDDVQHENVSAFGFDERARVGGCYFGWVVPPPRRRSVLETRRAGQRVVVTLTIRYGRLRGTLTSTATVRPKFPGEYAGVGNPRRYRQAGCAGRLRIRYT